MADPIDPLRKALDAVAQDKLVRFDRFMETVLYHPTHGYFAKSSERASHEGDFLTAPEVSPLFAECVLDWIEETWREVGSPMEFRVLEVGSGRGTLARGLLDALRPPFSDVVRFHFVERAAAPRAALTGSVQGAPCPVDVHADVSELPSHLGAGVLIANELFDNLPVRRIMKADGWKEVWIRFTPQRSREELVEAPTDLVKLAQSQGIRLAEGQTAEVCESAVPLLESILRRFDRGGLLVFDYGGEAHEVSGEAAPNGTIAAHQGHSVVPDLYAALGERDVTASVNFTPLRAAADRLGFSPVTLTTQSRFLLQRKLPERFVAKVDATKDPMQRLRLTQLAKTLYHPEAMGDAFRVMHARNRGQDDVRGQRY